MCLKNSITDIAIGGFDGIHRGHKKIIQQLGEHGGLVIIDRGEANLTPNKLQSKYANYPCFFYDFFAIKDLSGKEFLNLLQNDFKHLKKIVVGYDFTFGKLKSHNANDLQIMFSKEVQIIDEYQYKGISVHSSMIRQKIKTGLISEANVYLGREYGVIGAIIKGQGLGKKKLYATLNLEVENFLIPKNGVYATRTIINNTIYDSISFVGIRHSTDENFAIETHIIDKSTIINCHEVELIFVQYLRENEKFNSLESLKKQISHDIIKAKNILRTCKIDFDKGEE